MITGLGAITPLGNTVSEFWNSLTSGISGAKLISRFDTTHLKTKFACEVKDFDPLQFMEKGEVGKFDLFTQYALARSGACVICNPNEHLMTNRGIA